MRRYVETFFRHKLLFCLPVVLALFLSVWLVATKTASSTATTTMWFDTQLPAASSIDTGTQFNTTPAGLGQSVLQELATTRDFLTNVGHRGPLANYLATHHTSKHGPTALLSQLLHKLKGSSTVSPPVDTQIVSALTGSISSSVIGPQVLRVNLKGTDPTVTVGTLKAVTAEFSDEVTSQRQARDTATVNYYKTRLDAAAAALAAAKLAETNYLQTHPAVLNNAGNDPQFIQLVQAVSQADAQYSTVQSSFSDANIAATELNTVTSFHVIDAPYSTGTAGGKKKEIVAIVAGLFVGLFISILGLTAITAMDTMARRKEDFEDDDGIEVVGTIEQLPALRALSRGTKSS